MHSQTNTLKLPRNVFAHPLAIYVLLYGRQVLEEFFHSVPLCSLILQCLHPLEDFFNAQLVLNEEGLKNISNPIKVKKICPSWTSFCGVYIEFPSTKSCLLVPLRGGTNLHCDRISKSRHGLYPS